MKKEKKSKPEVKKLTPEQLKKLKGGAPLKCNPMRTVKECQVVPDGDTSKLNQCGTSNPGTALL